MSVKFLNFCDYDYDYFYFKIAIIITITINFYLQSRITIAIPIANRKGNRLGNQKRNRSDCFFLLSAISRAVSVFMRKTFKCLLKWSHIAKMYL